MHFYVLYCGYDTCGAPRRRYRKQPCFETKKKMLTKCGTFGGSIHPPTVPSCASFKAKPAPRCMPTTRATHDGSDPPSSSIPDTLPVAHPDSDWRAFRASLIASSSPNAPSAATTPDAPWAHAIPNPEPGCLLLSSPMFFTQSQVYFHNAVILVLEHGPRGSSGIILNKPTEHLVGALTQGDAFPAEYHDCRLYLGGDVNPTAINVLHEMPGLENSIQVLPGLFLGGFEGLKAALASGATSPDKVKVLARCAGWGPGQLEEEVKRGVWFVAAASKHVALQQGGDEAWHAVARLMGGEYSSLSKALQETFRADIMGLGGAAAQEQEVRERGPTGQQDHNHGSGI